jgi:hypothetical protein
MTPDPTATYEYTGQQEEHRGKMFKYVGSVTIQSLVPVHQLECGDGTTITIKTDRWQDVMKETASPNPLPEQPESGD